MKINGSISMGNVITLATMLITFAVAYGIMQSNTKGIAKELDIKADKELIEVKLEYLRQDVAEIKTMLKEL